MILITPRSATVMKPKDRQLSQKSPRQCRATLPLSFRTSTIFAGHALRDIQQEEACVLPAVRRPPVFQGSAAIFCEPERSPAVGNWCAASVSRHRFCCCRPNRAHSFAPCFFAGNAFKLSAWPHYCAVVPATALAAVCPRAADCSESTRWNWPASSLTPFATLIYG